MRFIKQVLIGIIGLSIVVTLFSLLMPSEAHGRRGIVVNAEKEKIFPEVNDFNNWKKWHPNFKSDSIDTKVVITNNGCDVERAGKTDHYEFTGNNDSTVFVTQRRQGENDIQHIFTVTKDQSTAGTYVDWKLITHLDWYPWEKFSGFFMESFTAPGMMLGLENIKKIVETKP